MLGLGRLALALLFAAAVVGQQGGWRLLVNYSDAELVTTELNRKFFYPRCLLFDSCDARVRAAALKQLESSPPAVQDVVSRNSTLETRMQGHPFLGQTLNASIVYSTLLALQPTHPLLYSATQPQGPFRVLYMSQGPKRGDIPSWYSQMADFIFLSYHEPPQGPDRYTSLFFPHSTFELGRSALYVSARLLELQQGWLYSYFVFLDDDVGLRTGSVAAFESELQLWQPAVAGPLFPGHTSSITRVTPTDHFDHLFIAYHREAVEVLFPKETQHNLGCWYHSDYLQISEQAVAFRNHLLLLPSMWVKDQKHREYPSKLCTFDKHLLNFRAALPDNLRGCVPPWMKAHPAYSLVGEARKKSAATKYFDFKHLLKRTTAGCSCWSPESIDCCTVDPDPGGASPSTAPCRELKKTPVSDGALLQCANERSVWLVSNQTRRVIHNGAVFAKMGLSFENVVRIKIEECGERLYWLPEQDPLQ